MTTLEMLRAEIEQTADEEQKHDEKWAIGLRYAVKIIDKYAEQEPMREFTKEEAKAYSKALDKMYKPTGFNVFNEPCDDAISREMALKECHDIVVDGERYRVIQEETLLGIPSVRPQEHTGHWINRHIIANKIIDMIVCSECGEEFSYDAETGISEYNFCPNCGAKMKSEDKK